MRMVVESENMATDKLLIKEGKVEELYRKYTKVWNILIFKYGKRLIIIGEEDEARSLLDVAFINAVRYYKRDLGKCTYAFTTYVKVGYKYQLMMWWRHRYTIKEKINVETTPLSALVVDRGKFVRDDDIVDTLREGEVYVERYGIEETENYNELKKEIKKVAKTVHVDSKIIELKEKGLTEVEIAKEVGLTQSAVSRALKRLFIKYVRLHPETRGIVVNR